MRGERVRARNRVSRRNSVSDVTLSRSHPSHFLSPSHSVAPHLETTHVHAGHQSIQRPGRYDLTQLEDQKAFAAELMAADRAAAWSSASRSALSGWCSLRLSAGCCTCSTSTLRMPLPTLALCWKASTHVGRVAGIDHHRHHSGVDWRPGPPVASCLGARDLRLLRVAVSRHPAAGTDFHCLPGSAADRRSAHQAWVS